ncbi:Malonyl CoA-acyl carrier protein transacylase [Rickettsiales bacterium Ac37b]|nr:Malonyl CoA-acyl carrier protein transacylase [Rickettsiales bacterium Ac37b]
MTKAFVFPGQGAQFVGMGKNLAENFVNAREVFEEVDEVLKQKLSYIIFNGSIEELSLTENTQPALMAVSMALVRVLEKDANIDLAQGALFAAGHSLGEYSALAAMKALTLTDTALLLRTRGKAMQQAVPVGQGGMAALLGLEFTEAELIATQAAVGEVCQIANDNSPGQIVLSGTSEAIDRAVNITISVYGKKAIKLNVSAPFHSELMKPAQDIMNNALAEIEIKAPILPIVANVTALDVQEPLQIRSLLVKQVTSMVKWRESIVFMKNHGVETIIEIGAGQVLTGLTKRIDKDIKSISINDIDDINTLVKIL